MASFGLAGAVLAVACGMAQEPPAAARKASISGVVRYAGSTTPVALATVSAGGAEPAITDNRGRYTISDLPPGRYQLEVMKDGSRTLSRMVVLGGFDLSAVDINFRFNGTISGRVLDDNREPVADAMVSVVTRMYSLGELQSRRIAWASTNARGVYRIPNIVTGEPVYLLATKFAERVAGISTAPEEFEKRARVAAETYYPNSLVPAGAQALTLRPGQVLGQVDIRMVKAPGYCAEGRMMAAGTAASPLEFRIVRIEAVFSRTDGFGSTGTAGAEGQFRICDLTPGEYKLTTQGPATARRADFTFGQTPFQVMDQDVRRLQVVTPPLLSLAGEVTWDGSDTPVPGSAPITIRTVPVDRSAISLEGWNEMQGVPATVPGGFRFPEMLMGDYEVAVLGLPTGQYVKDVTYGGVSVLRQKLRLGSAPLNSRLGIVVGRDGAVIAAQVNDGDGRPVIDAYVYALPAAAETEAALSDMMATGQTDRFGQFTTDTLPPGKYYVLAHRGGVGVSAFGTGRLWAARISQGTEVELGHGGFRQVRLSPVDIR